MATRERFDEHLKCPACGKTGTAECSEKDHPWGNAAFSVDKILEGFKVVGHPKFRQDLTIQCECGATFKTW